ncbi:MAG TPA: DUF4412 domain-containing protein [Thermoanaerobaculia bacterium]|jgi:hypothetical protein
MKRLIACVLVTLAAVPAMAGLTYRFESVSTGLASTKIAGTVQAEGRDMRVDLSSGDGTMFKSGAMALSRDGGSTITITDPTNKTYYVLNAADLSGGGAMLDNMRRMMGFRIENEKVSVRDAGDGGKVEGYPTRKSVVEASFDIVINAVGQTLRMSMNTTTETWATPDIGAEYANLFQTRAFKTGIEELDTVIAAQSAAIKGFPLKQVATVRVKQNTVEVTNVTTTTVTAIQKKAVPATVFVMPAGYTKTESPFEKMMR